MILRCNGVTFRTAGVGSGRFKDFREGAAAMVRLSDTVEPEAANATALESHYLRYIMIQSQFGDFLADHLD